MNNFFIKNPIKQLKSDYNDLENNFNELQKQYNILKSEYENSVKTKEGLIEDINLLEQKKNELLIEFSDLQKLISKNQDFYVNTELKHIDLLSGIEFEVYCTELLKDLNYNAITTKASGDGGVDILATKDGISYVFQCKRYSDTVGHSAVQEVYTAKDLRERDKAIIITNSHFSRQATKEANLLKIDLWDRNTLAELLKESYKFTTKVLSSNTAKYTFQSIDSDPLLSDVIDDIIEIGQVSTSFIQRRFKVGYARAGNIIDQLEAQGIISGYEGSKPRKVLITKDTLNNLQKTNN